MDLSVFGASLTLIQSHVEQACFSTKLKVVSLCLPPNWVLRFVVVLSTRMSAVEQNVKFVTVIIVIDSAFLSKTATIVHRRMTKIVGWRHSTPKAFRVQMKSIMIVEDVSLGNS